jgi:LPXTG-site transpeptidase (sortase) family protein
MSFRVKRQPIFSTKTRSFLRWSGYFFAVVGVIALGYVCFVLAYTKLYQVYLSRRFEQALQNARPSGGSVEGLPSTPLPAATAEANRARAESLGIDGLAGSPLGRIEISSIGLVAMVMEGTDGKTLRGAVGHIHGTALPGQPGNVAIAGHRDTFFRGLRNIHKGDEITLTTLDGSYRYRVDFTEVVEPTATEVLKGSTDPILTLVTCYPFYFVGPAPKRFIVRAHRISG